MHDKKAYQREYQKKRYHRLRKQVLEYLGGKCVKCGATEDLEFDHIDRSNKDFEVGELWGIKKETLYKELDKCQLLCSEHHREKTALDSRKGHRTWGMYRNRKCRCGICRAFVSLYHKQHAMKRSTKAATPVTQVVTAKQSNARRFVLNRHEDQTGTSGVGIVAEGIVFSNGKVALHWLSHLGAVNIYDSMQVCETLHGHGGRTVIEWVDA